MAGSKSSSVSHASLDRYQAKRDFDRTPEPAAAGVAPVEEGFAFVVHKHAARRLHYDLRLELGGVFKSWAVTKGPSADPAVKRLAVHVEDHPLEYAGFEGIIPAGQYGGGTVMIWDRGRWKSEGDPLTDYTNGKLSFRLHGKRMKGKWALVRMGGKRAREDNKNWLLIKEIDAAARPGDGDALVNAEARSVASKRTMDCIAADADRVWDSRNGGDLKAADQGEVKAGPRTAPDWPFEVNQLGAPCEALPDFVEPQLASVVAKAPSGDDWLHEIKFDGYRMQCRIDGGRAGLRTRSGLDWTQKFQVIADAAAALPVRSAMLDGEMAAMLPSGVSSFSRLQEALKTADAHDVIYYAFDLLFLEGRDLRSIKLDDRKAMLRALIGGADDGPLRFSDHHIASGPVFLENACRLALEGVVSKRRSGGYRSGRGRDWVKSKCISREDFVIGGFTLPSTQGPGIGALLVGYRENGKLRYAGRVGTGFAEEVSRDLRQRLDDLRAGEPPFDEVPATARRGVTWVHPSLACEVEFRSWTAESRLRHASFQGLKEDRPRNRQEARAKASRPVEPASGQDGGEDDADILERVRLTHPDRVLYPEQGLTKRGLAEYYVEVAPWILPHIAHRPLSIVRCPDGVGKACFYQKHITKGLPSSFRQVTVRDSKGDVTYPVVEDLEGLLTLVQMNALELHPWGARADDVERPDRLTFDLDPDAAVAWPSVVNAAFAVRDHLATLGLRSFVKTTGGKGLHVVVPIVRGPQWPEVSAFAAGVAETMSSAQPSLYTPRLSKAARKGKIFIDYLRNSRGATAVAAYSPRARSGGPVSTPLSWDEVGPAVSSEHFTVENLTRRLLALKDDPWREMAEIRQSLSNRRGPRRRASPKCR